MPNVGRPGGLRSCCLFCPQCLSEGPRSAEGPSLPGVSDQAARPAAPKTPAVVHGPYRRSRPAHTIAAVLFQAAGQLLSPGFAQQRSPRKCAAGDLVHTQQWTPNGNVERGLPPWSAKLS